MKCGQTTRFCLFMDFQKNVPLAPRTSFMAGGAARYFCAPQNKDEVEEAARWADRQHLPLFVLGQGSNTVFGDGAFPGLVIHTKHLNAIRWNENKVTCDCGAPVYSLVAQSVKRGLAGIEKLGGIPGTLSGAAYMNAGAYGQEFGDSITRITSITYEGERRERDHEACHFTYRHSVFWDLPEILLQVELSLTPGDKQMLEREMRESLAHRKAHQPLNLPNSGSVFKRPEGKYPGAVIEEAGLNGPQIGGAQVSGKHANFIINTGGATAQDLWDLSEMVRQLTLERTGVSLEREVKFVGEFLPWPR